ncbi:MAG: porin family protein, partial [Bacteroidota bacterium]
FKYCGFLIMILSKMKRIILLTFILVNILSVSAFGQARLSLKFSPLVTSNRVTFSSDTLSISNDGLNPRFSLGLIVDKPITDTYSFSTGLVYLPKGVSISTNGSNGGSFRVDEEYRLQYLQIPLTFKLFTNEVHPGLKIYFQVGGGLEVLLHDEPRNDDFEVVEDFSFFDASVILGGGVEYKLGSSTILYGGISYQRGLINIINETISLENDLEIRNTVVSLDLGIKF